MAPCADFAAACCSPPARPSRSAAVASSCARDASKHRYRACSDTRRESRRHRRNFPAGVARRVQRLDFDSRAVDRVFDARAGVVGVTPTRSACSSSESNRRVWSGLFTVFSFAAHRTGSRRQRPNLGGDFLDATQPGERRAPLLNRAEFSSCAGTMPPTTTATSLTPASRSCVINRGTSR